MPKYEEYKQIEKFLNDFTEKIILVDPLDRELYGREDLDKGIESEDLGTKIKQLEEKIDALIPIEGNQLFVPLSEDKYTNLKQMFESEHTKSTNALIERFEDAKRQEGALQLIEQIDPSSDEKILKLKSHIDFFMEHNLFIGIEELKQRLDQFVEQFEFQKETFRLMENINNIGQSVLEK